MATQIGRPVAHLDLALIAAISTNVSKGMPLGEAAALAGVMPDVAEQWRESGRDADAPPAEQRFALAVETAEATYKSTLVNRVTVEAATDWKAAAWLLERRAPDAFTKRKPGSRAGSGSDKRGTIKALAQVAGVSERAVREALDAGRIPDAALGRHPRSGHRYIADMEVARRALVGEVEAKGEDTTSTTKTLESARVARQQALADKAQLDVQLRRGQLVRRDDAQREINEALVSFREALTQLPSRLCNELAHLDDPQAVERVLDVEVRRVLHNLHAELSSEPESVAAAV